MTRIAMIVALLSSGCLVHRHPPAERGRTVVIVKERACRPNEYWDGNDCRQKGKGHDKHEHKGRGHDHDGHDRDD